MKKSGKPPIGKLHRDSIKRVSQTPKAAPGFPRAYPDCGTDNKGAEKKPK